MTGRPAVVLLSGGLDSATVTALARAQGFEVHALTMLYGQRHAIEGEAAKRVGQALGVTAHVFQHIDLRAFGGSALTDDIAVPKSSPDAGPSQGIPVTYVPARNTILLSFALAYAETIHACDVFIGVNAVDYSGYPDCRPAFIAAFEHLANVATKAGVEGHRFTLHAPLIDLTKAQIIQQGLELGVDFSLTHSCYDPSPDGLACGSCESCNIRRHGFNEANVADPTRYAPAQPY